MCRLSGLSRASLYRKPRRASEWAMKLRDALHKAALENPFYGYRRLRPELNRRGWEVGETRIRRLMREDNLLRLRKRRVKKTTDSTHGLRVYPHLARDFTPRGPNQLQVRHEASDLVRHVLDRLDSIVDEEDLSATVDFEANCVLDRLVVPGRDMRDDGPAVTGWASDQREIAKAG